MGSEDLMCIIRKRGEVKNILITQKYFHISNFVHVFRTFTWSLRHDMKVWVMKIVKVFFPV